LDPEFTIVEGPYFRDILDQPKALLDTWKALKTQPILEELAGRLKQGNFSRIVLTGMGSSYFALHPLNLALLEHGLSPILMETSELIHYGQGLFEPSTLLVAVSQSGQTVEIVRMLELNRMRASIIGVTNTPHSPLAELADAFVPFHAGEEASVPCKTYVSSLLVLRWLADVLCSRDPDPTLRELAEAPRLVENYLARCASHVWGIADVLEGARRLFLVGRGPSLAAVGSGSLSIQESNGVFAEGLSSARFRHGPMGVLDAGTFVLVFGGDSRTLSLNTRLSQDIQAAGARSVLCCPDSDFEPMRIPSGPEGLRPILEILPVQMITLALAAMYNQEAGRFERSTHLTAEE